MKMIDFEYDGQYASSFGMVVANLQGTSDELEIGSELDMSETKAAYSDRYYSTGTEYKGPFELEISIVKDPCEEFIDEWMGEEEINDIVRWLNRKSYCRFKPIYDDGSFNDVYYMGTFNVKPWMVGSRVGGFVLDFKANAPYGYREERIYEGYGKEINVYDESDELAYIYPEITLRLASGGTLQIVNSQEPNRMTQIENCQAGEEITFHGDIKQITTNSDEHKQTLGNDFNYQFPRITNKFALNEEAFTARENLLTLNIECEYTLTYTPVRKVGILV